MTQTFDDRAAFGELLMRYRQSAGLSQGRLAERCGLSERSIRAIESGATARPRRYTVDAIGAALGLAGAELTRFRTVGRRLHQPVPVLAAPPDGGTGEPGVDLIGRQAELRSLAELIAVGRHRLIVVTGPAGVGKSRLVAEAVAAVSRRTALAACHLDLSAATSSALLGELVAEALGASGPSRLDPVDRLAAHLRGQRSLLVLDSFERVLAATGWIRALVQRCAGLTVLITSQVRLGADGERELRLEPLAVPGDGTDPRELADAPAVRLLVRRAALVRPGFAVTAGNATALAAICRKVDGLPLALELAAARLRMLTPAELADRLDRRLELLADGPRDVPDRHRCIRAAIESSLEVVGDPARELFTWLGSLAGGVRLADLEAVAGELGRDRGWVLRAVADLVDASLVRVAAEDDVSRYRLPDAMAELAGEQLGAGVGVRRAVATHYLARLCHADTDASQPVQAGGDADNVRSALAWLIGHEPAVFDRAALDAVYRYHETAGRFVEGQAVLAAVADALGHRADAGYARLRAGRAAAARFDLAAAERLATEGLGDLAADDHSGQAMGRLLLAMVATNRADLAGARTRIRQALGHGRRSGDDRLLSRILNNLGNLAMQLGDLAEARDRLTEALAARRRSGAGPVDTACTVNNLAEVALEQGDHREAERLAGEGIRLARSAVHDRLVADTVSILGLALLGQGRTAEALTVTAPASALAEGSEEHANVVSVALLRRSVVLHAAGDARAAAPILAAAVPMAKGHIERVDLTLALEWHAFLLAERRPAAAARLLGVAGRYRAELCRPVAPADQDRIDRTVDTCRARLGPDRLAAELAGGAALDRSGVVALCGAL